MKVKKKINGDIINAVRLETTGHVRKKREELEQNLKKFLKTRNIFSKHTQHTFVLKIITSTRDMQMKGYHLKRRHNFVKDAFYF